MSVQDNDEFCPDCSARLRRSESDGFWPRRVVNTFLCLLTLVFGGIGIHTLIEGFGVRANREASTMDATIWLLLAFAGSLSSLIAFVILMVLIQRTRRKKGKR